MDTTERTSTNQATAREARSRALLSLSLAAALGAVAGAVLGAVLGISGYGAVVGAPIGLALSVLLGLTDADSTMMTREPELGTRPLP